MRWKPVLLGLALCALAADQTMQYTVLRDGRFLGYCVAPFDPPLFIEPQFVHRGRVLQAAAGDEKALAQTLFDAELGWCPLPLHKGFGATFDELGARVSSRPHAVERGAARRILAFGCSYTMGSEVSDGEAWPALVEAELEDVELLNLGVAGYGMDQAYLRFRRDGLALAPDEVWFGLLPAASLRVSTHFAPACNRWDTVAAFKPRFVPLEGSDELRLAPNPAQSLAETARLLTDQRAFFDALSPTDLWVRRCPAAFAPRGTHIAHWTAATRLLLTALEAGERDRGPWLEDPSSEVYRTLKGLLLAFARDCEAAHATFRVVVLPAKRDLALRAAAGGRGYWQGLVDDVAARGIETFDVSPALAAAGGAETQEIWAPDAHYNAAGNALVARAIVEHWFRER